MLAAKLTRKYQASIPAPVRKKLDLTSGDYVIFEEERGRFFLRKLEAVDKEYLKLLETTLACEWDSENDEKAYRGL